MNKSKKIARVNRIEVIDWTKTAEVGRSFVKWVDEGYSFNVYVDLQDNKRTLKLFLIEK